MQVRRRNNTLREGDDARYTHNNGETEIVRVIRVHTAAEGGGYTVRVPSQNNRERSTIAERVAPLPSSPSPPPATGHGTDGTNGTNGTNGDEERTDHSTAFSQMMTVRLIMSSGAQSGTSRTVTTTDTERLADLIERILGGELRQRGQRARLVYRGRVLNVDSTVGGCGLLDGCAVHVAFSDATGAGGDGEVGTNSQRDGRTGAGAGTGRGTATGAGVSGQDSISRQQPTGPAQLLAADPGFTLLVLTGIILTILWCLCLLGPPTLFGRFSRGALAFFTLFHLITAIQRVYEVRQTESSAQGR